MRDCKLLHYWVNDVQYMGNYLLATKLNNASPSLFVYDIAGHNWEVVGAVWHLAPAYFHPSLLYISTKQTPQREGKVILYLDRDFVKSVQTEAWKFDFEEGWFSNLEEASVNARPRQIWSPNRQWRLKFCDWRAKNASCSTFWWLSHSLTALIW